MRVICKALCEAAIERGEGQSTQAMMQDTMIPIQDTMIPPSGPAPTPTMGKREAEAQTVCL